MIWCLTVTVWSSCSQRWLQMFVERAAAGQLVWEQGVRSLLGETEVSFRSRSGSRSETLKFECRLQADSCPHTRSPSWWSQQVATSRPSPDKKCFSYYLGWFLAECTFTTMGPPLSPSQLSCPPDVVPAHTKIFGIHSFWPEFLKTLSAVCYS